MGKSGPLIETSFADAIEIIGRADELPAQTRRHWATSLRQAGKLLDRPLNVIPARYNGVHAALINVHEVPAGLTLKTLRNHKSNVKSALLWLTNERALPKHGVPLSAKWIALRQYVRQPSDRYRLTSLMRFASAQNISPEDVDESFVERLLEYRRRMGRPADAAFRRRLARAWNTHSDAVAGWPSRKLLLPDPKPSTAIGWEAFSERLRREVDEYLDSMRRIRKGRFRQRLRPAKESTIRTRRAELQAAARMAVKVGVPIETLSSLAALLAPEVVEMVLDRYWSQNGERPKRYTIDLAAKLLIVARETGCLGAADFERLEEIHQSLEDERRGGLTDKNIALIRHVLTPGVWSRVVNLPNQLLKEARRRQCHSPVRAAVTAQIAVAIAILTVAPVRLANLSAIKLGFNLIKPGDADSCYWLVFPDYDVKNRVSLNSKFDREISDLIECYVREFRPILLREQAEDWLFPGKGGRNKNKMFLSSQVTRRVFKATGLRLTVHQFRHAAGAIILMNRPGEYQLVQQVLGHRSVQTTMSAYIGLDSIQASELFGKMISQMVQPEAP